MTNAAILTDNSIAGSEVVEKKPKLARAALNFLGLDYTANPWSPNDIDKFETTTLDPFAEFVKLVKECRFFYEKDPIASTVLNKTVDIGITELVVEKGKLSVNEHRIFLGILDALQEFAENCALEFLISGLVVPEIKYAVVSSNEVKKLGIKKYGSLILPVSMWLRDPATIKINYTEVMDKPSYYVKVPDKMVWFILNDGAYQDGTKDLELYQKLLAYYPEFVRQIKEGVREILLDNDLIIRRKVRTGSAYPIPYLKAALEAMHHKRNLRKMDYSVASRVISAIQLFRLGDKDFPVTEDDEDAFSEIKDQMLWRNSGGRDVERIFQLFANHTLEIEWILPPVDVLLNEKKYAEVNDDIFFALGFPRILTTGESQRTGTSDPEFASLSPLKSMESMRRKILTVMESIVTEVANQNSLVNAPKIRFKPISMHSFMNFVQGLKNLYDSRIISRSTYADAFGYNFEEELNVLAEENDLMRESGIEEFAPAPFSPKPGTPGQNNNPQQNDNTSGGGDKNQ